MKKLAFLLLPFLALCQPSPAFAQYPAGKAQRQLQPGMTTEQVVAILGDPDAVDFTPGSAADLIVYRYREHGLGVREFDASFGQQHGEKPALLSWSSR